MAIIECVPNISEGARPEVVLALAKAWRPCRACACSTSSQTPPTTAACSHWPATPRRSARAFRCSSSTRWPPSTSAPTAASTPAWAPWTWCRSSRLKARRWPSAWRWRARWAPTWPSGSGCRSISTKRRPRAGAAQPRGHPPRRVRGPGREDGSPRVGARLRTAAPHVSAGATVIGARMPLIAYNINLATDRLDVAKKIAAPSVSSGGSASSRRWGSRSRTADRAGVDEPHQLREDAGVPGVRPGAARGRPLRRAGARERDRRARPRTRASSCRGSSARGLQQVGVGGARHVALRAASARRM
jgi:hypothetical protein